MIFFCVGGRNGLGFLFVVESDLAFVCGPEINWF